MTENQTQSSLIDRRRPAHGWGRLLVGVFAIFGILIMASNLRDLVNHSSASAVLNTVAALGYLTLATCVAHNGQRMRLIGWACTAGEFLGVVLALVFNSGYWAEVFNDTIWGASEQRTWWYLPVILPLVAAVQIWLNDPLRIVTTAERFESLTTSVRKEL